MKARPWPSAWPPFLWGVATSSHQVEGDNYNDWTQFEDAGRVPVRSGQASGHWSRYREDLFLFRQLGVNSYRFSVEWSRIEPQPGHFNPQALAHYQDLLDVMIDGGMRPVVTLHHFTLPVWLAERGGFAHPDAPARFQDYVAYLVNAFGDRVDLYITINEPMVLAVMGYAVGLWPPGKKSLPQAWNLANRLAIAHKKAYHAIKALRPGAWVGLAHHRITFWPYTRCPLDTWTARLQTWLMNDRFIRLVEPEQDFLGLNYYTRQWSRWTRGLNPIPARPGQPVTDMGWEVYPPGLEQELRELGRYGRPVIVTENGIATSDDQFRIQFLTEHLRAVSRAQAKGVDVRGYFYWSALDNFEWAEGFRPRFGLIAVDYATMKRTIRASGRAYRTIIEANMPPCPGPIAVPPTHPLSASRP